MSIGVDRRRRYASAAFVTLLILSVSWPSPIVSSNRLWLGRELAVDELSFLGREAPSWDVVFWCIAGLLALAVVHSGDLREWRTTLREAVAWSPGAFRRPNRRWSAAAVASVAMIALTWLLLDAPVLAFAETIRTERVESVIRAVNRFGGGMNPPMIVLFFALAGVAYRTPAWIRYAAAMAVASLSAGAVAHALKLVVGRVRPELWLGPFHYARGASNSFPSGHTVGAFAIAGVLLFASRNWLVRAAAILLATAVGLARIVAFRHWTSDVVASALLGLAAAWVAVVLTGGSPEEGRSAGSSRHPLSASGEREPDASYASSSAKETETRREQPASSIVTP